MSTPTFNLRNEIKALLADILHEESLENYQIEINGTSTKGDGFIGDIYFVNLISTNKSYNFVLKCGKSNGAVRESIPIAHLFLQEIYMYKTVFPAFRKFQIERNICDVFDNVPKCYGISTGLGTEVIVLENLKTLGYGLWDKRLPLPRRYIETVLKIYGKWHAISAAMQDQQPEKFQTLLSNITDTWTEFCDAIQFRSTFVRNTDTFLEIWKRELPENIFNEWVQAKNHIEFDMLYTRKKSKIFNVITHGDCWNNNFMFKVIDNGKTEDIAVALLDWQFSLFISPVVDVSYFLYSCISEEDLEDFDDLLKLYHQSFTEHLTKLGSNPEEIYTYSNLLDDWKQYARAGIQHALLAIRIICAETDDLPDVADSIVSSRDVSAIFCVNVKDIDYIKRRSKCIMLHAVERELLEPIKE